jgi:hypothetical protein
VSTFVAHQLCAHTTDDAASASLIELCRTGRERPLQHNYAANVTNVMITCTACNDSVPINTYTSTHACARVSVYNTAAFVDAHMSNATDVLQPTMAHAHVHIREQPALDAFDKTVDMLKSERVDVCAVCGHTDTQQCGHAISGTTEP